MLKRFLFSAGQMLLSCAAFSAALVLLGKGPWIRWLAPTVLLAVSWGIANVIRQRRSQPNRGRSETPDQIGS